MLHVTDNLIEGLAAAVGERHVMPVVARQLPLGAEAAQLTAMFMSSE